MPTPTPTPVPPVVITVVGSYSPIQVWNSNVRTNELRMVLDSVTTYDASNLPPGVLVRAVDWLITGTLRTGETCPCSIQGTVPGGVSLTGTHTTNRDIDLECFGPDICPPNEWVTGPPYMASCTLTTTDDMTHTKSVELVRA